MRLSGQTALVTGGGRGIGRAVAIALAAQGCDVAVLARTAEAVSDVAAAVNETGRGRALGLVADVRDRRQVAIAVASTVDTFGPITLLVSNAGTPGPAGREWEVDPDAWWECVESIVRGAFHGAQAVLPTMVERGGGRIIEMASVLGTTAWPLVSATSVAKTALIRHVENLAASCADLNVKVFALHPGIVRTELLSSYRSDPAMAALLDSLPDEAYSPPEVAAGVVVRIAAGELDRCSGCFVDATSDLDADGRGNAARLRLTTPRGAG